MPKRPTLVHCARAGAGVLARTGGGAIALWFIGRAVIGFCGRVVNRWLVAEHLDVMLGRYIASAVSIILNVVLVIAILGIFGVETTTFAALLAAAGVAIGVAWGGMLGNFAAGVFLVIFRPFRTGDFVSAGGITGTVHEIGMFATSFDTADNVRTIVGNNKLVSDTIQNFSTNPYRRVELTPQLAHRVDVKDTVAMLKGRLVKIPGRCWRSGRSATTRTTGRSTSIRTR